MKPWQLIFTGTSILKIDSFTTERKSSLVKETLLPNPLLLFGRFIKRFIFSTASYWSKFPVNKANTETFI